MIKEIKYTLKDSNSLKYMSKDGKEEYAKEILLRAPTRVVLNEVAIIKGQMSKLGMNMVTNMPAEIIEAMQKIAKQTPQTKEKKGEEGEEGRQQVELLFSGEPEKSIKAFDDILKANKNGFSFALIDSNVPFTDVLLDRLSVEDYEAMFGFYIESFLSKSLPK